MLFSSNKTLLIERAVVMVTIKIMLRTLGVKMSLKFKDKQPGNNKILYEKLSVVKKNLHNFLVSNT